MAKSDSFRQEVNELLDEPYECGVTAKSALQVIYEDVGIDAVAAKVTHTIPDLKVAPYYGCILNRPPEIAQFDDPENPVSMDKILAAAGVEVCDFAFKVECCGAAFGVPKRDMVNRLTYKVLTMAIDAGANCIAVACPLCQQNLDLRQEQVNSLTGSSFNIPVLYFSQIMGLAYGYSPEALAMDKVIVSADRFVRTRITVQQAREAKELQEQQAKAKGKSPKAAENKEETKSEEIE
jgi:heterodisulfide reductase subunit B